MNCSVTSPKRTFPKPTAAFSLVATRQPVIIICALLAALCLLAGAQTVHAQDERASYDRAKADFKWLLDHPKAAGVYQNWQTLADRFTHIYSSQPAGTYAPACLLWASRVHQGAWERFHRDQDFHKAVDVLRRLISHFPDSRLADDAQFKIGEFYEAKKDYKQAYLEYLKVTTNYPQGDQVDRAKKELDDLEDTILSGRKAQKEKAETQKAAPKDDQEYDATLVPVTEFKHWSTPSYTRVVLGLKRPVPYTAKLLRKDTAIHKPRRLFLDLRGARLTPKIKDTVPIGDGLLARARAGQYDKDTVRLVLDIKNLTSYKVFTLDNPFRVVVDCFGPTPKAKQTLRAKKRRQKVPRGRATEQPPTVGLAAALGLGIKRVVIDPGHGGKDPGTLYGRLKEKDIVLDIARRTAKELKKRLGCQVLLTRNSDRFIPLEARTAYANTKDADLFVSIHINAAPSSRLRGIETFFLNLASDESSMRTAALENATTKRSISDLQVILNDLMLNSKINESNRLARAVQGKVLSTLRTRYSVRDLKVKQAPFYVLIGARMPAVLIETGFITNSTNRKRLAGTRYRQMVAEGIARGIKNYAEQLKLPAATRP